MSYEELIGKKVRKTSRNGNMNEPKPFKSGSKINTVKGIVMHPQLNIPAYTFHEDDSYVACRSVIQVEGA